MANKIWEIDVRRSGDVRRGVTSGLYCRDSGGTTTSDRATGRHRRRQPDDSHDSLIEGQIRRPHVGYMYKVDSYIEHTRKIGGFIPSSTKIALK